MKLNAFHFLRSLIFDIKKMIVYKIINSIISYSFETS